MTDVQKELVGRGQQVQPRAALLQRHENEPRWLAWARTQGYDLRNQSVCKLAYAAYKNTRRGG